MFEPGQPRIILVCDHGKVLSAHLLAEGKIVQSFANEEDALRDAVASQLLEQINGFEARYKKNEVALRAGMKRIVQTHVGPRNAVRRDAALSRINERGARQKAGAAAALEDFRNR